MVGRPKNKQDFSIEKNPKYTLQNGDEPEKHFAKICDIGLDIGFSNTHIHKGLTDGSLKGGSIKLRRNKAYKLTFNGQTSEHEKLSDIAKLTGTSISFLLTRMHLSIGTASSSSDIEDDST